MILRTGKKKKLTIVKVAIFRIKVWQLSFTHYQGFRAGTRASTEGSKPAVLVRGTRWPYILFTMRSGILRTSIAEPMREVSMAVVDQTGCSV